MSKQVTTLQNNLCRMLGGAGTGRLSRGRAFGPPIHSPSELGKVVSTRVDSEMKESIGLLWPVASLGRGGRQRKSDSSVTRTQMVSSKHTAAPAGPVFHPARASVGTGSEDPTGREMADAAVPAVLWVFQSGLETFVLQGSLPGSLAGESDSKVLLLLKEAEV